jgi:hypothetical protein
MNNTGNGYLGYLKRTEAVILNKAAYLIFSALLSLLENLLYPTHAMHSKL